MLASPPMAPSPCALALGVMFIAHAYLKFAVFTVPGFAGFLGSVGLPAAWPGRSSWPNSLGGVAILVGFHSRLVSLALLPILLGALVIHAAERLGVQRARMAAGNIRPSWRSPRWPRP